MFVQINFPTNLLLYDFCFLFSILVNYESPNTHIHTHTHNSHKSLNSFNNFILWRYFFSPFQNSDYCFLFVITYLSENIHFWLHMGNAYNTSRKYRCGLEWMHTHLLIVCFSILRIPWYTIETSSNKLISHDLAWNVYDRMTERLRVLLPPDVWYFCLGPRK